MSRQVGKRLAPSQKKGKLTRQHIILIAVIAVLAVALAVTLAIRSLFVRPELPVRNDPQAIADTDGDRDGDGNPEDSGIDYGDGIRPRGGDGERKSEDYWTVLILGRDTGGGGNTDTILLASYDVTNQKATVMSIPRDTMVNVPWDVKRINSVYNYYGGGERGIQHLYKEIAQLVGFEPDFQVVVEWEAVGEIVNAMGGVNFEVPQDMNYDDPYQDLHIHQTAGYRLLDGNDAMQVLRYRHDNPKKGVTRGYPDGDLGRIKTQQAFLKAMVQQLLQVKNMTKIGQFIEVFKNNVETDMSFQNILWFARSAVLGGLKMEDVNFVTMPNSAKYAYSRTVGNMQSYVVPSARKLLELVNNELSPFTEVFTLRDLDIMSVNADGSLSSSTGYVEDKKAALPPPKKETPPGEGEGSVLDENGNPINPETGTTTVVITEGGENGEGGAAPGEGGGTASGGQNANTGTPGGPAAGTGTGTNEGTGTVTNEGTVTPVTPGEPNTSTAPGAPPETGFTIIDLNPAE